MSIRVKVRYPNGRVAYFPFQGATCLVGRAPDSDVQIRTSSVSWRHLRLQRRGDEVLVEDLGSSAGTTVGDRPLLRGVVRPIDVGESIWIDQFEIQVEPADAPTEVLDARMPVDPEPAGWQPPPPTPSPEADEGEAAFGGWLNELSTLQADSGVEVSVERTRVTVKQRAAPSEKPVPAIDVEPIGHTLSSLGEREEIDPSDLPTTKVPALKAGPLDATIRVERPALERPEEPVSEEILRVPVPRPLDPVSPRAPADLPRSVKGVPTWQMVSEQSTPEEDGAPRGVPVPAFEQRIRHRSSPSYSAATPSGSGLSGASGSSVALDSAGHGSLASLPWGRVLKAAGVVALTLGLAGVLFMLIQILV